MSDNNEFDAIAAAELINNMWKQLGDELLKAVPDILVTDPAKAIRWARCAEACFWQATGDSETHNVKDILADTSG